MHILRLKIEEEEARNTLFPAPIQPTTNTGERVGFKWYRKSIALYDIIGDEFDK